jgi:hypothetical protein
MTQTTLTIRNDEQLGDALRLLDLMDEASQMPVSEQDSSDAMAAVNAEMTALVAMAQDHPDVVAIANRVLEQSEKQLRIAVQQTAIAKSFHAMLMKAIEQRDGIYEEREDLIRAIEKVDITNPYVDALATAIIADAEEIGESIIELKDEDRFEWLTLKLRRSLGISTDSAAQLATALMDDSLTRAQAGQLGAILAEVLL